MLSLLLLVCPLVATADPPVPYRTDFVNAHLPWYHLKPGEFPPYGSEHRVGGDLVKVDFIHRTGQFRMDGSGALVNFTLLPFASAVYLNAYADLRDLPLGTHMLFFLYQDEKGAFTRVANLMDNFSVLAGHGFSYRLDEVDLKEGKLLVRKQNPGDNQRDLGRGELLVNDQTRLWKGDKQVKATDLAVGDQLLFNFTGAAATQVLCTDVWIGASTHKFVAERQRRKHNAFLKARGLPAWIDRVDGDKLTVTLFSGDQTGLKAFFNAEDVVRKNRAVYTAVANEELRTYNPPVDSMRSKIVEIQGAPTDCFGCSGERWIIKPELLLEGYRKGHVVRLFIDGWPIKDMPKSESLYE